MADGEKGRVSGSATREFSIAARAVETNVPRERVGGFSHHSRRGFNGWSLSYGREITAMIEFAKTIATAVVKNW